MGIQRYVFFSIDGCDKHPEVPLMEMKRCTEDYLKQLDMPYTVLRLCGFMQVSGAPSHLVVGGPAGRSGTPPAQSTPSRSGIRS
jgi:uncharacterized protein YbjT (DUF2867 family)